MFRPSWRTCGYSAAALFGLWLVGQAVKDRTWLTGLFFYVPSPAVAAGLVILGALLWYDARTIRRVRVLGAVVAVAALAPTAATFVADNRWEQPEPVSASGLPTLRVVHWNIWYGRLGWKRIIEDLIEADADLVMLSEILPEADLDLLASMFDPPYTAYRADNLAIMARGSLTPPRQLDAKPVRVFEVEWGRDPAQPPLRVFMVDMPSNPLIARVPAIGGLARLMEERKPDIVAGDLNTPRRSLALSNLPAGYVHAYEAVGRGWSYTWPCPVPMLSIDHCILGPRLIPLAYELRTLTASDHRMQVAGFAVAAKPKDAL